MVPSIQQRSEVRPPTNRAELDALISQRNELQSQLRNSEQRRAQLTEQVIRTDQEHRGTITQRIATLDQRNARLESQVTQLDEAIASGMANPAVANDHGVQVIAEPGQPIPPLPPIPPIPSFPEGFPGVPGWEPPAAEIHPRVFLMGGLVTLSLMALVAWVTWRRAVKRFTGFGGATADRADVSRLQQSVDTIALEVERISENQRFVTRLLSERGPELASGGGRTALPVERSMSD
jgi:hypothetical protein